ncbi:MAG: hypothetical protein ABWY39_10725 [Mycobacterium sp.]
MARRVVGVDAGVPANGLGPQRLCVGLVFGQLMARWARVIVTTCVQAVARSAQRLEALFVVDVKAVVRESDRLNLR